VTGSLYSVGVGLFGGITLERSDDSGATWNPDTAGITLAEKHVPVVPFIIDSSNPAMPHRMWLGTDQIYENTNNPDRWTPLSQAYTHG
jgi:hypothetical protein